MAFLRTVAVLVLAAALVLQASAAPEPRPFDLKKIAGKVKDAVVSKLTPTINCLSKAGVGDAALSFVRECGQMGFYGKLAMAGCASSLGSPKDYLTLMKSGGNCLN